MKTQSLAFWHNDFSANHYASLIITQLNLVTVYVREVGDMWLCILILACQIIGLFDFFLLPIVVGSCERWAYNSSFCCYSNWWLLTHSQVHLLRIIYLVSGFVLGHAGQCQAIQDDWTWMHQHFVIGVCLNKINETNKVRMFPALLINYCIPKNLSQKPEEIFLSNKSMRIQVISCQIFLV